MRRPHRLLTFLLLLVVPTALLGHDQHEMPKPVQDAVLNIQFKARLLEPGLKSYEKNADHDITFGPVNWDSADHGVVMARLWNVRALIEFALSADRRAFQSLRITPASPSPGRNPWDVWRHRYGFSLVPEKGYFWNSLGDVPEPMEASQGLFFDHYIKDVWSYWTIKRLPAYLSSEKAAIADGTPEDSNLSVLSKPIKIKYDVRGLTRTAPVQFQIFPAGVPVTVFFDVMTTTTQAKPRVVATGKINWTYDRGEWRRRHGYQKTLLSGYEWGDEFPTKQDLSDKDGVLLDALFDRTIAYWVDVAFTQALADINFKVTRLSADLRATIDLYSHDLSEN